MTSSSQPLLLPSNTRAMIVHSDCHYFRGDLPCRPHKEFGYHCSGCPAYASFSKRILIIKLGAMGDVIRTTPLAVKLKAVYPEARITWITLTPDILPKKHIHEVMAFDLKSALYIQEIDWDIAINLDKDKEACALLKRVSAKEKFGFVLKDGQVAPINHLAEHKFLTGLFDDVSKANTLSYPQEIFNICGFTYAGESYLLDDHSDKGFTWDIPSDKPVIGLNTGCGDRWTTRLWSTEKWIELIHLLNNQGYTVVILGGAQEHPRNEELQQATGALYFGHFPLQQFINLVAQCDLVVTQVTMAMHITLGLGRKMVLMNNIFNPYEFNVNPPTGKVLAPDKACKCFYLGSCVDGTSCMETLRPEAVAEAVAEVLVY